MADANLVNVAAENSVHPYAGVFADNDVADELGRVVNVGGFGDLGSDAFVGADHRFSNISRSDCPCRMPLNAATRRGQKEVLRPETRQIQGSSPTGQACLRYSWIFLIGRVAQIVSMSLEHGSQFRYAEKLLQAFIQMDELQGAVLPLRGQV